MVKYKHLLALAGAFGSAALIAACGGGGGGGALPGPNPSPSPSPFLNGMMQVASGGSVAGGITYSAASAAQVVFSCGCTAQAGVTTSDGSGNFTAGPTSTATPLVPLPTYTTQPGRNYLVVATTGSGAEAWTLQFLGRMPSHNHYLEATNVSDAYTTAAALYIFQNSPGGTGAFDDWDFTSVAAWVSHLQTAGAPNVPETTLLNDIVAQSVANKTLFPAAPSWNPSQATNAKIKTDITNVTNSGDLTLPVSCGSSPCGAEPTP